MITDSLLRQRVQVTIRDWPHDRALEFCIILVDSIVLIVL